MDNNVLSVVLLNGKTVQGIKFENTDTIKELKEKINDYNESGVDFKIVYCGRSLTDESEIFSSCYKEGQNKLYLLTAGVKGGCCGGRD